jgi:hypothetical protein
MEQTLGKDERMVCPNCRSTVSNGSNSCIFCGNVFTRKGKSVVRYEAGAKKTRRTFAGKAQRFFLIAALFFGAVTFGVILFSPEIPWYASVINAPQTIETPAPTPALTPEPTPAATPEPAAAATPEPTATATSEPTPSATPETVSPTPVRSEDPAATPSPETNGAFNGINGNYPIIVFLSEVDSDDPETQQSAGALLGERMEGTITLSVDGNGDGTIAIDQGLFPPDEIAVSAFVDSEGAVSANTLYGTLNAGGYKLTVVCVCADQSISGFLWMDDALTHIEFLYFG